MTDSNTMLTKWIPDFEGLYKASSNGNIYSLNGRQKTKTCNGVLLMGGLDKDGYRKVILCKEGKRYYRRVHVLVALTFIGDQPRGTVVCHNDGDLTNNEYTNLRFATQKENIADKKTHGTLIKGEQSCKSKLTEAQVLKIYTESGTHSSLSKKYGVGKSSITAIKTGRCWGWLTGAILNE